VAEIELSLSSKSLNIKVDKVYSIWYVQMKFGDEPVEKKNLSEQEL
jgi:hypothetical protein